MSTAIGQSRRWEARGPQEVSAEAVAACLMWRITEKWKSQMCSVFELMAVPSRMISLVQTGGKDVDAPATVQAVESHSPVHCLIYYSLLQ